MGIEESFQPGLVFGEDTKIYLDQKKKQLIVSSAADFKTGSTAIITSEQIIACETNITDCEFHITLKLRPPGPDQLHVLLNSRTRPQGPQDDLYLEFQMQLQELAGIIRRWHYKPLPGDHYLGPIPGYFENLRRQQTPPTESIRYKRHKPDHPRPKETGNASAVPQIQVTFVPNAADRVPEQANSKEETQNERITGI